jgi:serine protease inhibitor
MSEESAKEVSESKRPKTEANVYLKMFKEASDAADNFVMSPYTIYTIIHLLEAISDDEARLELQKCFPGDDLLAEADGVKLAVSIWTKYDCVQEVMDEIETGMKIEVYKFPLDVTAINDWCSKNTNGAIKSVVKELKPNCMSFIPAVIYFDDTWKEKFHGGILAPFNGEVTEYMSSTHTMGYTDAKTMQIVSISYEYNCEAVVMLPHEDSDIRLALEELMGDKSLVTNLNKTHVKLVVPEFLFETSIPNIKDLLISRGVTKVFEPGHLTRLFKDGGAYMGDIYQSNLIEFNKKGTRAASVTVAESMREHKQQKPRVTVTVDRPFLFMIRYEGNDDVYFFGKYTTAPPMSVKPISNEDGVE